MAEALDVARYFAVLAGREPDPEPLTGPRLHGLLFYAQGWHLGSFGHPLFANPIEARDDGPRVVAVEPADATGPHRLAFRDRRFVDAVWDKYRIYSAAGLRELATAEAVWPDLTADALARHFRRRDELRHFDPAEWEAVTAGEAEYEAGRTVPLADALARLRSRCATK